MIVLMVDRIMHNLGLLIRGQHFEANFESFEIIEDSFLAWTHTE